MKLPLRLLEQVTGKSLSAHTVAQHLESVGFPVEEITELLGYDPARVTAQVTGIVADTDDGIILTVENGGERHQAYSHVPVAPESVVGIAMGTSDIAKRVLNGRSTGASVVVLTEHDLGLEGDAPVLLPEGTPLGVPLTEVLETTVLDVEITPNRGDLYSVFGLARELSTLIGEPVRPPEFPRIDVDLDEHKFSLAIEAKADVHQYYGFVIDKVQVKPSPFWLRWILYAFGARAVNNVVDVTNYTMFLTGQPLHAFDGAQIHQSTVKVRRAKPGERFTAIDHKEYKLSADCLLIADAKHPLALAGVMGGEDSEVGPSAIRLFLESAEFDPRSTRYSISHTGLQSDSSKRFAAGVDGTMVRPAALVFIDTLAQLLPDILVSGELAYGSARGKSQVAMSAGKLELYTGKRMDMREAARNLELIGFGVRTDDDGLVAQVPSHRNDVAEDVDIIEEVLRLSGYDDLPTRFEIAGDRGGRRDPVTLHINKLRNLLSGVGLKEAYTLSLVSAADIPEALSDGLVEVTNPLTERMNVMRTSLMPGLLKVAADNIRFGERDLAFYEIGNVYTRKSDTYSERLHLGIILSGSAAPVRWDYEPREVDFFDLKGIIESLAETLGLGEAEFEPKPLPAFDPDQACQMNIDQRPVIILGKVAGELGERFEIEQPLYFCEVDLTDFVRAPSQHIKFKSLSRFHKADRDIAMLVDADQSSRKVVEFVRSQAGPACVGVDVFDSFTGNPLPAGKRNLGLRLWFQSEKRNFTKEELDEVMTDLSRKVQAEFSAVVRGREGDGN